MTMGLHLLVDGFTATPPTTDKVERFVRGAVAQLGLHIIAGPFFFNLESHQEVFAVIAESHVAMQWWPDGLVLVDIFSCKPFEVKDVVAFIAGAFGLEHWRPRVIERMGVG